MSDGRHGGEMSGSIVLRSLGIVAVIGFLLVSYTPLPNALQHWVGMPAQVEPAAAIVVLGGGMEGNGVLSNSSLRRALRGIVLFRQGLAPLLAFSGPAYRRHGREEAEVRAEMARLFGVSPAAIVTETVALTTREEAARMAALLQPMGVDQILLVTSYAHMARSQRLFENVGFTVWPAPVDDLSYSGKPETRLRVMRGIAQEFLARTYYQLVGYL
jgi:uncharacterized SAM-binding protein YcdF (DUF218 family)